jgi:hypothetical protein
MLAATPYDMIGPYGSEAEAKRVFAEMTDLDNAETASARKKAYDPSRDPTPASDASISIDNEDLDAELNGEGEGVQLELQQTEKLRDVPPEVQGD